MSIAADIRKTISCRMMLYQGILMYNFGQKTEDMQTFLLYSKYHDGLVIEHFAEELFRQSIALRTES